MKTLLLSTALAAAVVTGAAAAFTVPAAASEGCNVPRDQWQPEEVLRRQLEDQGWQVRRMKVDDGCYEVYATDKEGRRREVYFDPRTLQPIQDD